VTDFDGDEQAIRRLFEARGGSRDGRE